MSLFIASHSYSQGRRDYDGFPAESTDRKGDKYHGDFLFTITEAHLDSGMRGIPVGTCKTSFVDPIEGVHYVGYPVEDPANLEEEDAIHRTHKRLPTEEEPAFRTELAHRAPGNTQPALSVF